ncbi:autophagy-related protein 9A [Biomphalaria pfeifferi]|uniref:Autophagy-related protein 9 n=1 Tax=Biomphalaria pfeifferi TaxID=112525 RepID=A0AAD8BQA1_BIOPF|nr:autophagy-related protein 9A [Biomphalaria pfeifferi]
MASDSEEIEYQALGAHTTQFRPFQQQEAEEEEEESDISLHEEQGFLVHMSPEANKTQWNHVDDLDKFFTSVYEYHQRHGFQNMVLSEILQLVQFVFVVLFMTYLSWCVNYAELFDEVQHNSTEKKTFSDITYPLGTCISKFSFLTWLLLFLCILFLMGRSVKMAFNFSNYLRTHNFFISALNTETRDLSNMTWHEVQLRLLEVQKEQQICIHKQDLTQLDIYHRILRFKNYLVAMVNKDLLPLKFRLPFIGEHAILTHGMRFNLDVLLYWSPWSIFVNSYTMREEYKNSQKKKWLAERLSTHIGILALLNFVLCPFIFFYQIIYFFFRYAEFVKRSPSFLGSRQWANYGRLYLRHFNELDHELNARLNRAYIPSKMYMNSFTSPSLTILAKYLAFFAGAPAAVLFVLGILDFNDVTKVEHLFTVASVCGMVATICSSLIPDENEVFCPERLMMSILAQIHYMPDHWKGRAHTSFVRDEFAMLFQYKLVYIIEELLSPLITPFWLFFMLRPKSSQIVDFFRCFTVEVAGVGDVCSFAQMDIKKHGNPQWTKAKPAEPMVARSMQAENGKIELSLMHFATTNPEWKPPQESHMFINGVKYEVQKELPALTSIIADPISLPSLGYVNPVAPILTMSTSTNLGSPNQDPSISLSPFLGQSHKLRGGLSNFDGPLISGSNLQTSLTGSDSFHAASYPAGMLDEGQRELLSGNMSLSVLHIHETHHRQRHSDGRSRHAAYDGLGTYQDKQPSGATSGVARPQSIFPHRQQFQTYFGCSQSSSTNTSRTVIAPEEQEPYSHLYRPPQDVDHQLTLTLEDQAAYSAQNTQYCDEDGFGLSDFSSLPPLAEPGLHYGSPTTVSSTPSPGQHMALGARLAGEHMPEIKEDSIEHEIDTSMS